MTSVLLRKPLSLDRARLDPSELAERFDDAVEWIVGALLVFAPLAYGTTERWSQEIFIAAIALAAAAVAAKWAFVAGPAPTLRTWALLPIGLFLALVLLQLVPLPAGVLRLLSPGTVTLKTSLLQDLPDAAARLRRQTISFYPWATWLQFRLLLAVSTLFVIALEVYRDAARIRRLLGVIAAVGWAVAGLAVYQNLSGTRMIYGLVPMAHRNAGPFANYSHFSQFVNLSMGAAGGLLLARLIELFGHQPSSAEVLQELREPRNASLWALAGLCVVGPITVCLSMSRMGVISMLVAAGGIGALLAWQHGRSSAARPGRRRRHASRHSASAATDGASVLLILGIIAFAGLLCFGFDSVYDRLATVEHFQASSTGGSRLELLRDMLPIFRTFPLLGTGLGTHEFVFPMFDRLNIQQIATHAEDEYAQMLEECGAVGLLLVFAFAAVVLVAAVRLVRSRRDPIHYAGFGLVFGLVAILIHSASDFGQHVPADAALTALFCALLITMSEDASQGGGEDRKPPSTPTPFSETSPPSQGRAGEPRRFLRRFGFTAGLFAVLAAGALTIVPADRARRADAAWTQAQTVQAKSFDTGWDGSNQRYIDLLKPATLAASIEPTNITYQYWVNVYRWHAISRDSDRTGRTRLSVDTLVFARRISDELEAARWLCPTYGPPLSVAGQINLFALHRPFGESEIRTAYRLTPYDPIVCFITGAVAAKRNDEKLSLEAVCRFVMLGGTSQEAVGLYLSYRRPDLAYEVARGNRQELESLAAALQPDPAQSALADRCRAEADDLLYQEVEQSGVSPELVARYAGELAQQGKFKQAVELYRRALNQNYAQVDWRMQLAQLLEQSGKSDEAVRELRVCLRLRPQLPQAQAMLADFTTRAAENKAPSTSPDTP